MAERRVQIRQGRREKRRDGDGDGDLKRRSRSEGPAGRRMAQSMDVSSASSNSNGAARRANQGHGSFERRGIRADRDSPLGSDDGGRPVNPDPSGSDSDSDTDRMQWTKNPLIVRKLKKNKAEKRNAGSDNANNSGYSQLGQRSTNRESWVYLSPEGTPLPGAGQERQRADNGSSSGSLKSKYQKLEEMRKKRIDIAMTSDEENTPESRISRLRQRALQGALGTPARTDSSRMIASDHNSWGRSGARGGSAVMSDQGTRQANNPPISQYGKQSVTAQPQAYRSGVVMQAPSPARQSSLQQAVQLTGTSRQSGMVSTHPVPAHNKPGQGSSPLPQAPAPVRQGFVRPFTDTGFTEAASPGMVSRQQFYTIPEPQVGSRVVHNSSPEIHVRRFKPAVRIPSADSLYDGANNIPDYEPSRSGAANRSVTSGRVYAQVNPPSQDVMEVQRGTAQHHHQQPASQRQSGASKFNEVVELRLRSSRVIDRPLSQSFEDTKRSHSPRHRDEGGFRSEDSLDELIESNIQYLEKEMKQGGSKKLQVPVSRSSSLPDPRKSAALASKPQVTVSGQQSARSVKQVPAPTQSNKSELHFRVPLSPQTTMQPAPKIHIAEENQLSDSAHGAINSYTFGVVPRVERKLSYDSRTRSSRPTSEHYDRDDVSKSDTQLNAAIVAPIYRGTFLHPNNVPGRGYASDQNLTVDHPQGMFSDVEYDIEVAERVKKWETFMKKPDPSAGGDAKKPVLLTPIEERTEGDRDSLMVPSEIRRSLRMAQQARGPANLPGHDQQLSLVSMKPANSDPTLHMAADARVISTDPTLRMAADARVISTDPTLHMAADARVISRETNLHRFFQVVQDPTAGLQTGPQLSQSTSSLYIDLPNQGPKIYSHSSTVYQPGGLMSADELRQHMLANQRSRSEAKRSSAAPQLALPYDEKQAADTPDRSQRLSRYQDEIEEMKTVKHQSVSNLRRRFDEGKVTTSEDESRPDSRVAKVSPTQKDGADVSWSQMITGLEDRIRDMEVWSPNMESTQGNVVSIERVKARTLQTIPFSEDPFWKEIEEMTTFDPNSLGGHLSASEETFKPSTAQIVEESPHSSTLPSQPRMHHSAMSMKERMQRSKSLYTPNITPLTINVDPYSGGKASSLERGSSTDKYSGPSALDEVLEDIRTSLERKPLSPKRKPVESSDSHRSSPGPSQSSDILRSRLERTRAAPVGQPERWDNHPSSSHLGHLNQPMSITISSTAKPAPPAAAVLGMTAGHYHLDPHLLRQKLLSTGLVEEDNKPEPPVRSHVPAKSMMTTSLAMSKPVAVAPPQAVVRSMVAPTQRAAVVSSRPPQQEDKLSQVTNTMEELRQLAVNVERKINEIKSRLITADDQNLDNILLSLRKLSPSTGPYSPDVQHSGNMEDFYHSKKSKLQDALMELERIHRSLDIDKDVLRGGSERRDYSSYRAKPLGAVSAVNPTSSIGSTASPSRLMSSSAYISPLSVATVQAERSRSPYDPSQRGISKADVDRQAQSEFDVISKSFQAIIDEVNKTASLVSSASTPQPRTGKPLPEIKELKSKLYANREQDISKQLPSPEIARRPLDVTLVSQQVNSSAAPTPKSPPAVAPKPPFRMPVCASPSQPPPVPSVQQAGAVGLSIVTSSIQTPVTSVVHAEMAKPAPEKRDPRVRGRFRPKPANQEKEEANRRARSKSSPTITLQDLQDASEGNTVTAEEQPTAKSQLSFQLEPAGTSGGSRKPPLKLDVARAQQGSVVELQLKPPAMFQDGEDTVDQSSRSVVAQSIVIKPSPESAPPPDGKTVVFPETPTTCSVMSVTMASSATQSTVPPSKADVSSSESSAEGRERKGKQKMGRGVAMMVELFSSSDEERLRRSHPLHTRSAPDLSADILSDDAISASKNPNIRPAEITRLKQHKTDTGSAQASPAAERKRAGGGGATPGSQGDSVSSPQSPSNKPPFHPFRRQPPSPDCTAEGSPQRSLAVTEPQAASADTSSTADATRSTTTVTSASKVTFRARPPPVKNNADDDVPERPRSFHELLSTFEPDLQRLNKLRSQGKCASEEGLQEQIVVARVFRAPSFTSEPDLRSRRDSAPTPQEVRQWKL